MECYFDVIQDGAEFYGRPGRSAPCDLIARFPELVSGDYDLDGAETARSAFLVGAHAAGMAVEGQGVS